jgi:hypothetical protein
MIFVKLILLVHRWAWLSKLTDILLIVLLFLGFYEALRLICVNSVSNIPLQSIIFLITLHLIHIWRLSIHAKWSADNFLSTKSFRCICSIIDGLEHLTVVVTVIDIKWSSLYWVDWVSRLPHVGVYTTRFVFDSLFIFYYLHHYILNILYLFLTYFQRS